MLGKGNRASKAKRQKSILYDKENNLILIYPHKKRDSPRR